MFVVKENIEIKKMGNQYYINDISNGVVHVLDDIAGEILLYMQKGLEINAIVNEIVKKYAAADEKVVYRDVEELIENFKEIKIII